MRLIIQACEDGVIRKTMSPGCYAVNPHYWMTFWGESLTKKQIDLLRVGPGTHVQMIHRLAMPFWKGPYFKVEIDESVRAPSGAGAWGTLSHPCPDLMIRSAENCPYFCPIWVEYERTFKVGTYYLQKLARRPKDSRLIYVLSNEQRLTYFLKKVSGIPPNQIFCYAVAIKKLERTARLFARFCENYRDQTTLI